MVRAVRQDRQMISEYVALYFKRVLAPTFRLTDVLGVLLPPIIAAYQAYRGTPMLPDSGQDAFVFIGYIAVAVLGLRILATPYLLWRDDQAKIGGLTQRINDLEDIPASGARDAAREARKRLAHDTATILSIAQQWISQPHLPDMAEPLGNILRDSNQAMCGPDFVNECKDFVQVAKILFSADQVLAEVMECRRELAGHHKNISESLTRPLPQTSPQLLLDKAEETTLRIPRD